MKSKQSKRNGMTAAAFGAQSFHAHVAEPFRSILNTIAPPADDTIVVEQWDRAARKFVQVRQRRNPATGMYEVAK